ncbi:hypothetical protein M0R45_016904 [Rubus argutus]|uniref:Uncharacterized protein n=1 Tax=Rubus argutus TaxID=59490 RepID=A0AAW1XUM1_RUBAR
MTFQKNQSTCLIEPKKGLTLDEVAMEQQELRYWFDSNTSIDVFVCASPHIASYRLNSSDRFNCEVDQRLVDLDPKSLPQIVLINNPKSLPHRFDQQPEISPSDPDQFIVLLVRDPKRTLPPPANLHSSPP